MPEHLRALVVILGLAAGTFWLLRPLAPTLGMADADFVRRRNVWFTLTLIAFLSGNFWVFISLAAVLLLMQTMGSKPDPFPVALCLFVAFAVPPFSSEIPFVAGIRYLFAINHLKLVLLTCLVPVLLKLWEDKNTPPVGKLVPDYFVLGFYALPLVLQFPNDSFTNVLRAGFDRALEILVPYYVLSRAMRTPDQLREALAAFVTAAMLLAPVSIFEGIRYWLLYAALPGSMNIFWAMGSYLGRGSAESLRAAGSTGHAIALGYLLCVGLFAWLSLQPAERSQGSPWRRRMVLLVLAGGIYMAKSRGPWVGAVAGLVAYALLGAHPVRDITRMALSGVVIGGGLLLTPFGDKLIDMLPFVGSVDADTVDYRQQLLVIGWRVVLQNPLFGAPGFMAQMEALRQGQGIIDIVNSYLGIALASGLVGLGLFAASFGSAMMLAFQRLSQRQPGTEQAQQLVRGLLAGIICILVTIFTTSSITIIPFVFWSMLGLLVGAVQVYWPVQTASRATALRPTGPTTASAT